MSNAMRTPYNALTGIAYSGGNIDTLLDATFAGSYRDPAFVTFRQALKLGRCVRKGESAAARIKKVVKTKGAADDKKRRRSSVRTYCVFNIAQTDEVAAADAA